MIFNYYFILVFGLLLSHSSVGQTDFGVWMQGDIKSEISDRLSLGLETQLRLDDNAGHIKNRFLSPSISFKAHKFVQLGTSYRLSSVPFNSSIINRVYAHRYTFDLEFQKIMDLINDKSDLGISMRLRETTELESQNLTENTLRYKLKFDYSIPKSKLKPFLAGELFYRFNNQLTYTSTNVVATNAINKLRLKFGFTYKMKRGHSLKFYSLIQKQLVSQRSDFILGVSYSYKLYTI